jgi:hypothetical protein
MSVTGSEWGDDIDDDFAAALEEEMMTASLPSPSQPSLKGASHLSLSPPLAAAAARPVLRESM